MSRSLDFFIGKRVAALLVPGNLTRGVDDVVTTRDSISRGIGIVVASFDVIFPVVDDVGSIERLG